MTSRHTIAPVDRDWSTVRKSWAQKRATNLVFLDLFDFALPRFLFFFAAKDQRLRCYFCNSVGDLDGNLRRRACFHFLLICILLLLGFIFVGPLWVFPGFVSSAMTVTTVGKGEKTGFFSWTKGLAVGYNSSAYSFLSFGFGELK